jgi:hypothetical protein
LGTQQENHQKCSCMPHIYTTALMSTRRSTYKDVTVLHCIIPVTLFLVSLYNAFFRFQHNKTINLLISVLDCFNLGTTVDNDTFMTTISKSTNSALISKQEFHAIINNFAYTQFFTLHSFIYSWAFFVRSLCSKYYLN